MATAPRVRHANRAGRRPSHGQPVRLRAPIGRELTCHQADDSEKTELPDAAAVVAVLRGRIGIDVAGIGDRAALRVRLDGLLG